MELSSRLPRFCLGTYEGSIHGIGVAKRKKAKLADPAEANKLKLVCWFASLDHIGAVRCVAASESGRWLVSGGSDETLRVYDMVRLVEYGTLHRHDAAITSLAFHADSHLLSGSEDGTVFVWMTRGWECLTSLKGHTGAVNSIAIHQSGKVALSVGRDCTLRMWNLVTGRHMLARQFKNAAEPLQVRWSPVCATYAVLFRDRLMVCDQDGQVVSQVRQKDICHQFHCFAYVHEFLLAVGTESGQILFWDLLNHRYSGRLQHGPSRVRSVEMIFGTDSSLDMLLSISTDGSVLIWNALKFLSRGADGGEESVAGGPEDPDTPLSLEQIEERARERSRTDRQRFEYGEYALPLNRAVSVCLLMNNPYPDSGAAASALMALAEAGDEDVEQLKSQVDPAAEEDGAAARAAARGRTGNGNGGEAEDAADDGVEMVDRKGKDLAQRRKQRKKKRDQQKMAKFQEELQRQQPGGGDENDGDDMDEEDGGPSRPLEVVSGPSPDLVSPEAFSQQKRKKPVHKPQTPANPEKPTRRQRAQLRGAGLKGPQGSASAAAGAAAQVGSKRKRPEQTEQPRAKRSFKAGQAAKSMGKRR